MTKVIAFESSLPFDSGLTWGAAAIETPNGLLNSVNKRECSLLSAKILLQAGCLTFIKPITCTPDLSEEDSGLVLAVHMDGSEHSVLLEQELLLHPTLGSNQSDRLLAVVFRNLEDFNKYATRAIEHLFQLLLKSTVDHSRIVQIGLILDPTNPAILAAMVYFSNLKEVSNSVAMALLEDENAKDEFHSFFAKLLVEHGNISTTNR